MLDLRYLRTSPNEAEERLKGRVPDISLARLLALDAAWRKVLVRVEEIRAERNEIGGAIAEAKKAGENVAEAAVTAPLALSAELDGTPIEASFSAVTLEGRAVS